MRATLVVLCCLALLGARTTPAQTLPAQALSEGFDHFYNLEYDQAIADFTSETVQHPQDPAAWNHLAQAVLYRAMFRSGALESELVTGSNPFLRREKVQTTPAEHQQFDAAIDQAIQLCRTQASPTPGALSALGVAYGLRANYNFLVRKAWMDALHDASRANDAVRKVIQTEPDNVDTRLIPGVYDYVVGSLPWGYRFLSFLAGFHGNRNRGIRTLQIVAQKGKSNQMDAEILLVAIYRRERRPADALPLLDNLIGQFPRNYLLRFELVQMYSDLGDRDRGLREIEQIWELHRNGAPGFANLTPEKIDYLEGNFLFWYNDLDHAAEHLQRVTAKARELDLSTGIMAWMRLGQIYDLQNQREAAVAAYEQAVAMAPNSDVAKESRGYINSRYKRQGAAPASSAESRN